MTDRIFGTVVMLIPVGWVVSVVAWLWLKSRLGLTQPDAAGMDPRERLVRRNLRALLAFDFLVVFPLGVPGTILVATFEPRAAVVGLAGLVLFALPIPSLVASAHQCERDRRAGRPPGDRPIPWVDGLLDESLLKESVGARFAVALVAVGGACVYAARRLGLRHGRLYYLGFAAAIAGLLLVALLQGRRR